MRLPSLHHLDREISADSLQTWRLIQSFKGDFTGAGGDVEQPRTGRQLGLVNDVAAPAYILPERHQAVHQVIAPGDAGEHILDILGAFLSF